MRVLSLFDGMSCGQIALKKAGIPVTKYFASEIDKHAIKVTQANFPDTIQLGSVTGVTTDQVGEIDLLIGGSPCQGFSFAGKNLNFDDPRSKLFFEYVRLLKELKPKYFLMENVRMSKKSQDIISEHLGVEPIVINSNLVSAQNRHRLYWTNIPFDIPTDKGIVLSDIIEGGVVDREKSHCLDANYFKGGNLKSYFRKNRRQLVFDSQDALFCASIVGRKINPETGKRDDNNPNLPMVQRLEIQSEGHIKTGALNTVQKTNVLTDTKRWRNLTPLECERLQTVPEGYTNHVSNTQRFRMLGNGWTVDVIKSIFGGLTNG